MMPHAPASSKKLQRQPSAPASSASSSASSSAPTVQIATKQNKLIGARCAVCRQVVQELEAVTTAPTATRPTHVICLPKWAREAVGYDSTGTDASQCWYSGCSNRIAVRNLCTAHDSALYGGSK